MGVVKGISLAEFPKQSKYVGGRTEVCFNYNASDTIGGTVVRDDREEPWRTIIRLDDGRFVLATECQYSLPAAPTDTDTERPWPDPAD